MMQQNALPVSSEPRRAPRRHLACRRRSLRAYSLTQVIAERRLPVLRLADERRRIAGRDDLQGACSDREEQFASRPA